MAEGKRRGVWGYLSCLLALMVNLQLPRGAKRKEPKDFNPFYQTIPTVNREQLAEMFGIKPRNREMVPSTSERGE